MIDYENLLYANKHLEKEYYKSFKELFKSSLDISSPIEILENISIVSELTLLFPDISIFFTISAYKIFEIENIKKIDNSFNFIIWIFIYTMSLFLNVRIYLI